MTGSSDAYSWIIPLQLTLPLLFAAGLLLPIPALKRRRVAWAYSAVTSTISFVLAVIVALTYDWSIDGLTKTQFEGSWQWIPALGLSFDWGVDAITLWMMLLTSFLMPIVVISSLIEVDHDMRQFHFWLHILEAALIGTFVARDIVLFYVCFEFTLIPLFFLIGVFGHTEKLKAAGTFFMFTFAGSILSFAGIIYVGWYGFQQTGQWTFAMSELYAIGQSMPFDKQCWVFASLLAGFGVKTPLVPFHTWLPLAHTEAPTAGSVDLAGLVLKLGPYGLIRIAIPMLPEAAVAFAPWVALAAIIGILYAALICRAQKDAKRLIAYSSVSHMGFCALGLFVFDDGTIGATGAVVYMLAHGLATGGMFLCIGMLYDRFHTRSLNHVGGLAKAMPLWCVFFMLFLLASVGLPGLNNFVGEFMALVGAFNSDLWFGKPFAIIAALGIIFTAVYLLYLASKIVWGTPIIPPTYAGYSDMHEHGLDPDHPMGLSTRELVTLVPIAAMCLAIGLFPFPLIRSLQPSVEALMAPAQAIVATQVESEMVVQPGVDTPGYADVMDVRSHGSHSVAQTGDAE